MCYTYTQEYVETRFRSILNQTHFIISFELNNKGDRDLKIQKSRSVGDKVLQCLAQECILKSS